MKTFVGEKSAVAIMIVHIQTEENFTFIAKQKLFVSPVNEALALAVLFDNT